MAEAEEQAPVSPQSEGRSGPGEEAPGRTPESGAALGVGEPAASPAGSPGTEEPAGDAKKKIDVLLKAVGDTPIMKTKKWAVERTRTIQGLCDFIKKFLKLMASEQLFIYVNQSFAPSPDQEVGTLYEVTFVLNALEVMASLYYIIAKPRHGDESQAIELLRCDLQNRWTDFLEPNTQKKEFGDFCMTVHLEKVMQLNSMKEELLRLSNCIAFH